MKIAIIGAGFTGLAAAYFLQKQGHSIKIFEKEKNPGGLAIGYSEKGWEWTLEKHYHHWFTNDNAVLNLAKEIDYPVLIRRPKTSSLVDDHIYQLDSPSTLLKFPELSIIDRIRTGIALAFLRYNSFWRPLEHFTAEPYLKAFMGKTAYKKIWEPLMTNKLGNYANSVSLAWFWARIYKRTPSLAYPEGGFLRFAEKLVEIIQKQKGIVQFETDITSIEDSKKSIAVRTKGNTEAFDKLIVTLPSILFTKMAPLLPQSYKQSLGKLKSIGAITMVLRLKNRFLKDNTYWLNVCDLNSPILAVVEHTNFMDKKHYNHEVLVYVGKYLPREHEFFSMPEDKLFAVYESYLKKINPDFKKELIGYKVFKAPFAQPIIPINYSKIIPTMETPLPNVFLANIEQVYPWDRGTNYAVELGEKVANFVTRNNNQINKSR